jgi:hypothetical protein
LSYLFFVATNFTKFKFFNFWNAKEKNLDQFSKNYRTFFTQKFSLSSQKYGFEIRDPGSEIWDPEKTSSGSRGHKGPGFPIWIATFILTQTIGLVDLLIDALFGSFIDRLMDWLMVLLTKASWTGEEWTQDENPCWKIYLLIDWLLGRSLPEVGGVDPIREPEVMVQWLIACLAGACWRSGP